MPVWKQALMTTIVALVCTVALAIAGGWFRTWSEGRRIADLLAKATPSPLLKSGDCSQPCWHTIQPGQTTLSEARSVLNADNSLVHEISQGLWDCWHLKAQSHWQWCLEIPNGAITPNTVIERFYLTNFQDSDLQLAEILAQFGQPIGMRLLPQTDTDEGEIYFDHNITVNVGTVYIAMMDKMTPFSPTMPVRSVTYTRPDQPLRCKPYPWPGFTEAPHDTWKCQH